MIPPPTLAELEPLSLSRLREVPLLKGLADDVLEALRPHLYTRPFVAGEHVLRHGEYCDGAYYVLAGQVEARVPEGASSSAGLANGAVPVAFAELPMDARVGERVRFGAGDLFGEGSALSRYPIAMDFVSVTDATCLLMRTPALRAMFELPELASFKALFDTRYREGALRAHLARVEIFAQAGPATLEALAGCAELVTFKPGRQIAEEGASGDSFYLVRGGYVKVSTRLGGSDLAVTYLRRGDWAGEAALLIDQPWPYTLTAIEHVELVRIRRDDLRRLVPAVARDRRVWDTLVGRLQQRGRVSADPLSAHPLQFAIESGLIHGDSVLLIDLERCTRCDECVRACADAHDGTPRFVREGTKFQQFSVPTACYQCTDPVCMIGCPTGAITRPLGTLEVAIDAASCIGCGNCVRRCPWGNILTVPYDSPKVGERINLATKCDLCMGRPEGPACVQMCPQGCAERVSFKDDARVAGLFTH